MTLADIYRGRQARSSQKIKAKGRFHRGYYGSNGIKKGGNRKYLSLDTHLETDNQSGYYTFRKYLSGGERGNRDLSRYL